MLTENFENETSFPREEHVRFTAFGVSG